MVSGAVYINANRWPAEGREPRVPSAGYLDPKILIRASGNPDTVINDDGCNDGTLTRKLI